jgi:hypothetical protein
MTAGTWNRPDATSWPYFVVLVSATSWAMHAPIRVAQVTPAV